MRHPGTYAALILTALLAAGCCGGDDPTVEVDTSSVESPTDEEEAPAKGGAFTKAQWEGGFIVETDTALVARDRESTWSVELYKGEVEWTQYDPALELLWVKRSLGEDRVGLGVIDLRASPPYALTEIAEYGTNLGRVTIKGLLNDRVPYLGCELVIDVESSPSKISGEDGLVLECEKEDIAAVKVQGEAWLRGQKGREARKVEQIEALSARDPVAEKEGSCEDDGTCGRIYPFGATGWQLVIIEQSCGDGCYTSCLLRDPKSGQYAAPQPAEGTSRLAFAAFDAEQGGSCNGYMFDHGEARFAVEGLSELCTNDGACVELGGDFVGFLRPSAVAW